MTIKELYNAMRKRKKIYILKAVGYYPRASYEIYEVEILGLKTYAVEDSTDIVTYIDLDYRLRCGVEESECFQIDRLHKDRESAEKEREKLQKSYIATYKEKAIGEIRLLMREFKIDIDDIKGEK